MVNIRVRQLGGQDFYFDIDPETTVQNLKTKIHEQHNIDVNLQRIIFKGRVLRNENSLSSYAIGEGDTVHLVCRRTPQVGSSPNDVPPASASATASTTSQAVPRGVMMSAIAVTDEDIPDLNNILSNVFQGLGTNFGTNSITFGSSSVSGNSRFTTSAASGTVTASTNSSYSTTIPSYVSIGTIPISGMQTSSSISRPRARSFYTSIQSQAVPISFDSNSLQNRNVVIGNTSSSNTVSTGDNSTAANSNSTPNVATSTSQQQGLFGTISNSLDDVLSPINNSTIAAGSLRRRSYTPEFFRVQLNHLARAVPFDPFLSDAALGFNMLRHDNNRLRSLTRTRTATNTNASTHQSQSSTTTPTSTSSSTSDSTTENTQQSTNDASTLNVRRFGLRLNQLKAIQERMQSYYTDLTHHLCNFDPQTTDISDLQTRIDYQANIMRSHGSIVYRLGSSLANLRLSSDQRGPSAGRSSTAALATTPGRVVQISRSVYSRLNPFLGVGPLQQQTTQNMTSTTQTDSISSSVSSTLPANLNNTNDSNVNTQSSITSTSTATSLPNSNETAHSQQSSSNLGLPSGSTVEVEISAMFTDGSSRLLSQPVTLPANQYTTSQENGNNSSSNTQVNQQNPLFSQSSPAFAFPPGFQNLFSRGASANASSHSTATQNSLSAVTSLDSSDNAAAISSSGTLTTQSASIPNDISQNSINLVSQNNTNSVKSETHSTNSNQIIPTNYQSNSSTASNSTATATNPISTNTSQSNCDFGALFNQMFQSVQQNSTEQLTFNDLIMSIGGQSIDTVDKSTMSHLDILISCLIRNMTMSDIMCIFNGNWSFLVRIRPQIRICIKDEILNGDTSNESRQQILSRLSNFMCKHMLSQEVLDEALGIDFQTLKPNIDLRLISSEFCSKKGGEVFESLLAEEYNEESNEKLKSQLIELVGGQIHRLSDCFTDGIVSTRKLLQCVINRLSNEYSPDSAAFLRPMLSQLLFRSLLRVYTIYCQRLVVKRVKPDENGVQSDENCVVEAQMSELPQHIAKDQYETIEKDVEEQEKKLNSDQPLQRPFSNAYKLGGTGHKPFRNTSSSAASDQNIRLRKRLRQESKQNSALEEEGKVSLGNSLKRRICGAIEKTDMAGLSSGAKQECKDSEKLVDEVLNEQNDLIELYKRKLFCDIRKRLESDSDYVDDKFPFTHQLLGNCDEHLENGVMRVDEQNSSKEVDEPSTSSFSNNKDSTA